MKKIKETMGFNRSITIVKILLFYSFFMNFTEFIDSVTVETNVLSVNATKNTTNDSTCNIDSLDSTVQWIFYLQHPTRQIPRNLTELQEFCAYIDEVESQVDRYAKECLESLPRTLTSLLMFGVRRQNRYYCSTSTKAKTDYLDSARCLLLIKSSGAKCMNSLIQDMLSLLSSPSNKRIGRLCCVYYRFEDCLIHSAQDECQSRDIKRLEDLVHGYTGQMLSKLCMNYPKETDCGKLYPKRQWNEARRIVEKRYKNLPRSILSPLIEIISSLPPNFGSQ